MNLNYEQGNVNFKDGRKLITAKENNLNMSIEAVQKIVQLEADKLHKAGKQGTIGVAMHYKDVNRWVPALFSSIGSQIRVWSPKDSPDTEDAYMNDTINAFQIYILREDDVKYLKPKKDIKKDIKINKNIFKK